MDYPELSDILKRLPPAPKGASFAVFFSVTRLQRL